MEIKDVKQNLNKRVKLDDFEYVLKEYVYWLDDVENQFKHSLVLKELNSNSTRRVPMDKIETLLN